MADRRSTGSPRRGRRALHIARDAATSRALSSGPPGAAALTLYIADAQAGQVVEAALAIAADGWPVARRLRTLVDASAAADPQPGAASSLRAPHALARVDELLWVADSADNSLHVVDLDNGAVARVAGSGSPPRGGEVDPTRPLDADLPAPGALVCVQAQVLLALGSPGRIWAYLTEVDRIGPIIGSGKAGAEDGAFAAASLGQPCGLAVAGQRLLVADEQNASVRIADLQTRQLSTLVVRAVEANDSQPPQPAGLLAPRDVATAGHHVYVADAGLAAVVQVHSGDGILRWLTAPGQLGEPDAMEGLGAFLLVADRQRAPLQVVRVADGSLRPLRWK